MTVLVTDGSEDSRGRTCSSERPYRLLKQPENGIYSTLGTRARELHANLYPDWCGKNALIMLSIVNCFDSE